VQLDKTEWRTWRYLGGVQYSEEKVAEAVESFSQCLRLDPNNALAEDGLARSLEAQGKSAEAASAYQLAVMFNSKIARRLIFLPCTTAHTCSGWVTCRRRSNT
jgi:Flp pilus assembly protein TadD